MERGDIKNTMDDVLKCRNVDGKDALGCNDKQPVVKDLAMSAYAKDEYYSLYEKKLTLRNTYDNFLNRTRRLRDKADLSSNVLSFIRSLALSYKRNDGITEKQYQAFMKVEQDYFDSIIASRDPNWVENYDAEKREKARIVANYYVQNPPWYGDVSHKILTIDDFIPPEPQYNKMIGNAYSEKVLESHYAESKFEVGDYVSLRKNHKSAEKNIVNGVFAVLQIAPEPISSAARGTKKYKILPMNSVETYIVEERWLKKATKRQTNG